MIEVFLRHCYTSKVNLSGANRPDCGIKKKYFKTLKILSIQKLQTIQLSLIIIMETKRILSLKMKKQLLLTVGVRVKVFVRPQTIFFHKTLMTIQSSTFQKMTMCIVQDGIRLLQMDLLYQLIMRPCTTTETSIRRCIRTL